MHAIPMPYTPWRYEYYMYMYSYILYMDTYVCVCMQERESECVQVKVTISETITNCIFFAVNYSFVVFNGNKKKNIRTEV